MKIDYPLQVHEDCLDKEIKSGDVIEVRLKPLHTINRNANCFQMKLVHVNVDRDFTYQFDSDYVDLLTCEYTHYIYDELNPKDDMIQMYHDFLSNTARFPLVSYVTRPDCSDVVVIARLRGRSKPKTAKTIWKQGQALKLEHDFKIEPGDVIEIRLSNIFRYEHMEMPSHDDVCGIAENEEMECLICLNYKRDVVFEPCRHCCVCKICCRKMHNKMCPTCYKPYTSWHKLTEWTVDHGDPIYSTDDMDDVYSLLTRLQRHCV